MVIKTEVCAFSDNRIYPGHGVRFIRRDGQVSDATPNGGTRVGLTISDNRVWVCLEAIAWRATKRSREGCWGSRVQNEGKILWL